MESTIALLPGDGVGPEVITEAKKVLEAAGDRFGRQLRFREALIGGIAIDQTGSPLPDETLDVCKKADAVLFGAVGGPRWDDPTARVRPEQGLLGLRKGLKLFANLRPVRVHPALASSGPVRADIVSGLDLLVVRELTGGIYFGERGRRSDPTGEAAFDTLVYTTGEIERIVRRAAEAARARKRRLASVDKANVLESSRLWRATAERLVREEFPHVQLEHVLVDAASMYLIRQPKRFDVIVTGNMFGDILSDEASVLAGSMGLLASASLGERRLGLYEPIHGSAPDIAGKDIANPIAMIMSAAMLCRYSLGWPAGADCIETAVDRVIADGARTIDIAQEGQKSIGTVAMGDRIAEAVASVEVSSAA